MSLELATCRKLYVYRKVKSVYLGLGLVQVSFTDELFYRYCICSFMKAINDFIFLFNNMD